MCLLGVHYEDTILNGACETIGIQHSLAQSLIARLGTNPANGLVINSAMWTTYFKCWTCNINE